MDYSLSAYGEMFNDSVRMEAHEEALRRVVTPDSVVLDIGAGPGIMSLLAAKMGARRVIAVEPNPLVRIGARLAAENGFADRVRIVHGRSQQIELEEQADVVVADLRGGLPNVDVFVEAVIDARERLMKPGGVLIPLRDTIFAAPIEADEAWSKLVSPWRENAFELSMEGGAEAILNQGIVRLESFEKLLGQSRPIGEIEYMTIATPDLDAEVELSIETPGTVHGFSLWFETELVPGIGFSTAPDLEKTVYGRPFLPAREPLRVDAGDRIEARVKAAVGGDNRLWLWKGRLVAQDGSKKASFASSTAFFNPESEDVREVFHPACAPDLTGDGAIARAILDGVDGKRTVGEILKTVLAEHPDRFEIEEDAAEFVRDVLERFGDARLRIGD